MATKYITLEEAAAQLGITPDRLIRLREQGDIRGFADRGTWKFRPQDVEQLREKLAAEPKQEEEPDLDLEKTVPEMMDASVLDEDVAGAAEEEPTALQSPDGIVVPASDSDVRLDADEATVIGRPDSDPEVQLTVESDSDVRLAEAAQESSPAEEAEKADLAKESDSDVKMVEEPQAEADSDSDVTLVPADSDSDVRLDEETSPMVETTSDSDVALVDSDSDVRLVDESAPVVDEGGDSDSDVALVESDSGVGTAKSDSDSDVRLTEEAAPLVDVDSDSDVQLVGLESDSDVRLAPEEEMAATSVDSDSDVALLDDVDKTVTIQAPSEQEESVEEAATETGIEVEDESGISLATESGISLDRPVDSGISLEEDSGITLEVADESGIALDVADESGIALEAADGGDETESIPVLQPQDEEETVADTVFEVPSLESDADADFDLKEPADSEAETNVLLFDDDDLDDATATAVQPEAAPESPSEETFEFDLAEGEMAEGEEFGAEVGVAEEAEDLDVFAAEDVEFEETFEAGESQPEFVAPVGLTRAPVGVEPEWGLGVFIPLVVASVFLCLCGAVMFDLVRSIWGWHAVSAFNSPLLDFFGSLLQ